MAALVADYFASVRHCHHLKDDMADLVSTVHERFLHDEQRRRTELKEIQREFYKGNLVGELMNRADLVDCSREQLLEHAERILEKKGYNPSSKSLDDGRRSAHEERLYGALRVKWFDLCKLAGIGPVRKRRDCD